LPPGLTCCGFVFVDFPLLILGSLFPYLRVPFIRGIFLPFSVLHQDAGFNPPVASASSYRVAPPHSFGFFFFFFFFFLQPPFFPLCLHTCARAFPRVFFLNPLSGASLIDLDRPVSLLRFSVFDGPSDFFLRHSSPVPKKFPRDLNPHRFFPSLAPLIKIIAGNTSLC